MTSYFGSLLYLGIWYLFCLCIWVPSVIMFYWSVTLLKMLVSMVLCNYNHSSISSSKLLHFWFSFQRSQSFFSIGLSSWICFCLFSHFHPPILLGSWCVFVCHPEQIHKGIFRSSVPATVLSFPKYRSIISFFQFLYFFSSLIWAVEFIM